MTASGIDFSTAPRPATWQQGTRVHKKKLLSDAPQVERSRGGRGFFEKSGSPSFSKQAGSARFMTDGLIFAGAAVCRPCSDRIRTRRHGGDPPRTRLAKGPGRRPTWAPPCADENEKSNNGYRRQVGAHSRRRQRKTATRFLTKRSGDSRHVKWAVAGTVRGRHPGGLVPCILQKPEKCRGVEGQVSDRKYQHAAGMARHVQVVEVGVQQPIPRRVGAYN